MADFVKLDYEELSPEARKALPFGADLPVRIAVAKGLVPLGTRDLLATLYFLCADEDPRVRKPAKRSLKELPESLTLVGIATDTSPKILHFLASRRFDNHHIHEKVALHASVWDDTLVHLAAAAAHERVIEILGKNETAILRNPEILHRLVENPHVPRSLSDRLVRFYETAKGHAYTRDLPGELAPIEIEEPEAAPPQGVTPSPDLPEEHLHPHFRIEEILSPAFDATEIFAADLMNDPEAITPEVELSLFQRIARMTFVDRLLLALKGNAEARRFLIRASNKTIQDCVLRNPRLTMQEVVEMAKERTSSANIITTICRNRDWTKHYEVIHSLCWHPKTPIRFGIRFLDRLIQRDLEKISTSKMVPTTTASQARNLLRRREKR